MLGLLLRPNAADLIAESPTSDVVKQHALEVIEKGYTVIPRAISESKCAEAVRAFRQLERANPEIFAEHRDANGHYPRIVNLHYALPQLLPLFTRNATWLAVQDLLFGAPTALYTSLFYETGSQQALHRDTPVFCTRPEYLYFGTTVYLERADEENGCLEVMEGGHTLAEPDREQMALKRYGCLDAIPTIDLDMWQEYQDGIVARGKARNLPVKRLHVDTGDSLIWHPNLPHGGSTIRDATRTRFSLVMHTTPENVPVYHQEAFFNPKRKFPTAAPWVYDTIDGRKVAHLGRSISFGHVRDYEISALAPT